MAKYLIINADDYGLSPGINRGIIAAYLARGVSSTSIMVNMPGFDDAVSQAMEHPGLGIGLHFNLTYGSPISDPKQVPSLVQSDGAFHQISRFNPMNKTEMSLELEAQWNKLVQSGISPTHLDSHHLLHQQHKTVYEVMCAFASKRQVPLRRTQNPHLSLLPLPKMTDALLLDTYHQPDSLMRLNQYMSTLQEGITELTCHPGYADDQLRSFSEWAEVREAELATLCSPMIQQMMEAYQIQLISYASLRDSHVESASASPSASNLYRSAPTYQRRGTLKSRRIGKRGRGTKHNFKKIIDNRGRKKKRIDAGKATVPAKSILRQSRIRVRGKTTRKKRNAIPSGKWRLR